MLQRVAACCSVLQRVVACCSVVVLQCIAMYPVDLLAPYLDAADGVCCSLFQPVAACCSVEVCFIVLQCVRWIRRHCIWMRLTECVAILCCIVAMCCSVLQRLAECCRVMQSVLQCVAVFSLDLLVTHLDVADGWGVCCDRILYLARCLRVL